MFCSINTLGVMVQPHFSMSMKKVKFEDIRPEYYLNEEIKVHYVLDIDTQASSRNWVGLYEKGSTNLQEYLAFEWTLTEQNKSYEIKHEVTFCPKYYAGNVYINKDYCFLFVNKHLKVVGISPFFQFLPNIREKIQDVHLPVVEKEELEPLRPRLENKLPENTEAYIINELSYSVDNSHVFQQSSQQICSRQPFTNPHISNNVIHSSPNAFKGDITLTSPDFPLPTTTSVSNSNQNICSQCKRPVNFAHVEQQLRTKVKVSAEYSRTLEKRVQELEKKLEMTQVAQKQLKLAAHHAKREKISYQKFVNEMLFALSNKGAVRVLDGHGTELLLKRVVGAQSEEENALIYKSSHRERLLKAVISSQEKTIQDLLSKLEKSLSKKVESVAAHEINGHSILCEIDPHMDNKTAENLQNAVDNMTDSLVTIFPQKTKEGNEIDDDAKDLQDNLIEHVLDETYCVDNPISVILPPDALNSTDTDIIKDEEEQEEEEEEEEEEKVEEQKLEEEKLEEQEVEDREGDDDDDGVNSNNNDHNNNTMKPTISKANEQNKQDVSNKEHVNNIRQHMMEELTKVIRKRQEDKDTKCQETDVTHRSEVITIEKKEQKEICKPTALVIKGDRLQYAIIRVQQSSWKG